MKFFQNKFLIGVVSLAACEYMPVVSELSPSPVGVQGAAPAEFQLRGAHLNKYCKLSWNGSFIYPDPDMVAADGTQISFRLTENRPFGRASLAGSCREAGSDFIVDGIFKANTVRFSEENVSLDISASGILPPTISAVSASADLNHDKRPDYVIVANDDIRIFLSSPSGYSETPNVILTVGVTISTLLLADVNGDDVPDLTILRTSPQFDNMQFVKLYIANTDANAGAIFDEAHSQIIYKTAYFGQPELNGVMLMNYDDDSLPDYLITTIEGSSFRISKYIIKRNLSYE